MIKKILIILLLLLSSACAKEEEIEYIQSINNVFMYSQLEDSDLKESIFEANNENEFDNYQFKMLGKSIPYGTYTDINGNEIDFSDYEKIIFEVVSVDCPLCQSQLTHIDDLIDEEITFIQFFAVGDKDSILDLYGEQDLPNIIILPENEKLYDYVINTLSVELTPTLISFDKEVVTFSSIGNIDSSTYELIKDISFVNLINTEELVNSKGENILTLSRGVNDVKNDLSEENILALQELDNNGYTEKSTYELMGKKVDYTQLNEVNNKIYVNEVDDFSVYEDKEVILIYTYLNGKDDEDKINFINSLLDENYEYLAVLSEGLESSSSNYNNSKIKFNCKAVSMLSSVPESFTQVNMAAYPTAIFIDRGTITGVYSNITSLEEFKKATSLFLTDKSIAYKSNN